MIKKTLKGNAIKVRRESGEIDVVQAYVDYVKISESLDGVEWRMGCTQYRMGTAVVVKGSDGASFVVKATGEVLTPA